MDLYAIDLNQQRTKCIACGEKCLPESLCDECHKCEEHCNCSPPQDDWTVENVNKTSSRKVI